MAPTEVVFCFPSEPNSPEEPECEKISTLYQCMGRRFTNSTQKQQQLLRPLNTLNNKQQNPASERKVA